MRENKINLFLVHIICNYCNKHTLLRLILEKKKSFHKTISPSSGRCRIRYKSVRYYCF